jgi:hypothetical protein
MNASKTTDYGIALLRISLGVMLIAHSVILKYVTYTLPGTAGYFESIGLPGFLAYVVFGMEAVGGILLVPGRCRLPSSRSWSARSGCTRAMAGYSAQTAAAGSTRCTWSCWRPRRCCSVKARSRFRGAAS